MKNFFFIKVTKQKMALNCLRTSRDTSSSLMEFTQTFVQCIQSPEPPSININLARPEMYRQCLRGKSPFGPNRSRAYCDLHVAMLEALNQKTNSSKDRRDNQQYQ
jgi:hypothetical protein